ncbi:MAG: hypothetical protein WCP29_06995 [Acidobacteriota bacterium]
MSHQQAHHPSIFSVSIDGAVVCEATAADAPCEFTPSVELRPNASTLVLSQPSGTQHTHALNCEEGWCHLSVRLHPSLACEIDCVISASPTVDPNAIEQDGARGIRFQPVILDVSTVQRPDTTGKGLFGRGLHFSGVITRGNVSLSCLCDRCSRSFRLQSFHAGFSDLGYFYSASGVFTLVVPSGEDGAPAPLSDPDPVALAALESRLPPAPDGTRFGYLNPLRCPHCKAPYIDFETYPEIRANEYYGNTFFGERAMVFPSAAPVR